MPRVELLNQAPAGYGLLTSNPPQSILTKSAPCLSIRVSRSSNFAGRQVVRIMTYRSGHGWTTLGEIEITTSSIDPYSRRVSLADDVLYACAVDAGSSNLQGSVTVTLDESFERPTDSGLLAVEEHEEETDPHSPYMTQAEADARYAQIGGGGANSTAPIKWVNSSVAANGQRTFSLAAAGEPIGSVVSVIVGVVTLTQARGDFTTSLGSNPPTLQLSEENGAGTVMGMLVDIAYQPAS